MTAIAILTIIACGIFLLAAIIFLLCAAFDAGDEVMGSISFLAVLIATVVGLGLGFVLAVAKLAS